MFRTLLQELLQVPGANYCCIADGTMGKVLDSAGAAPDDGSGVSLAVLGWGATAAGYLAAAASDELDDLIVTSRRAYHLVRQFDGRSGQPLLIYLRLDRRRANLAVARRTLMAARGAVAEVPAQRAITQLAEVPARPVVNGPARGRVADTRAAPTPAAPSGHALPGTRQVAALPAPRRARPTPRAAPRTGHPPPPPLPQRTAEALPPAAPAPTGRTGSATVLGQSWADDLPTMRRLLTALRRMG